MNDIKTKEDLLSINRVERAIESLKLKRGLILVDNESRENEGDLIFAAENMQVSDMAKMIRYCSGIVCLCITKSKADSLDLKPMVDNNTSSYGTNFTVSIEAAEGVSTGVSAKDRLETIRSAIKNRSTSRDLNYPGHVFPLIAMENGVFDRQGHTEGSVDLMKLANLKPYSVLCELTNEDGSMSKLEDLNLYSKKFNYPIVSIDDIIKYRQIFNK
ncbi:MAG: 3,4-dihydroxy-2-butanone-4-phosphate synthase [Marinifilaceae bacterium]|jgi:3,4-dihydroxy 2-butanone 4-phosphate synthase|nr:3,4-dihydroxy-2-butanone-4-phosphate synthase [Marinifilaceae bacterium]